jgi:hypothetical protein
LLSLCNSRFSYPWPHKNLFVIDDLNQKGLITQDCYKLFEW